MKTFREFINEGRVTINEARVPWPKEVTKKRASPGDIRKGESYTVVNTKTKEVLWDSLKRESAKEVVEYLDDTNIIYGSSSFIYDKHISQWN